MIMFAYPWVLLLLCLLPLLGWWKWRFDRPSGFVFPTLRPFESLRDKRALWIHRLDLGLYLFGLFLLILGLARPQSVRLLPLPPQSGVEIVLALDVSDSMAAEDFQPKDRLTVSKEVLAEFVARREKDRIGIVVFGEYALTLCPLTMDQVILARQIDSVYLAMAGSRTAIGMGLAAALNRLVQGYAKSKIVILLTDGVNTAGDIGPLQAADLAKTLGIRVYTIGIGKTGGAPVPIQDATGKKTYAQNPDGSTYLTELDEKTLIQIAKRTGGQYYRAETAKDLRRIYEAIDTLERTEFVDNPRRTNDLYTVFLWGGFIAMGLAFFAKLVSGRANR